MKPKHFLLLMGTLLLIACVANYQATPMSMYGSARASFNNYYESYLNYRDTLSGPQKEALIQEIQPNINKGLLILNTWRRYLTTSDPYSYWNEINALIDELAIQFAKNNIKVKKE